ncbi:MAG: hypothetical protein IT456_14805 [Planctomycetes bacterium]|jgi:hypothetical protein|nr:hypothetical protein [Planctomycetota bacterium]
MRSQNDLAFHLRMAAMVIFSMFLEHLAATRLPDWSSPRIGVITFVLGLIWVALFAWQHGNEQRERLRILERRLTELGERTENLEDERRARRALPPL